MLFAMTSTPLPPARVGTRRARSLFGLAAVALLGILAVAVALAFEAELAVAPPLEKAIRALLSPWSLLSAALVFALIAFGAVFLGSVEAVARKVTDVDVASRHQSRLLVLVFAAFVLMLSGSGYLLNHDLRATFREERFGSEAAVARLKAQQVDQWVYDRTIDTQYMATALKELPLAQAGKPGDVREIVELLFARILAGDPERRAALLLDAEGRVVVAAGDAPGGGDGFAGQARRAARDGVPVVRDIHRDPGGPSRPRMTFLAPVAAGSAGGPSAFVVALSVDPDVVLFRKIEAWPTPSPTSEVLLVRREGDEVAYLTPPRIAGNALKPLELRLPLSTEGSLGALALPEGDGVRESTDYRGTPVLSASRRVTAIPWVVIAKTDLSEVMQPMRRRTTQIALVFGTSIVVAALLMAVLWLGQRQAYRNVTSRHEAENVELRVRYERIVRAARDIVLLFDAGGRILEGNDAALLAYGYSQDELTRMVERDLRAPEDIENFERHWQQVRAEGRVLFDAVHRRKDGSTFPVEVAMSVFDIDGRTYRQAFVRDITERRALEEEYTRLARVQRALQVANHALLRAQSEDELFRGICNVIVEAGGYRMANIAVARYDEQKSIYFPAIAGHDSGYLAGAAITWSDAPTGRGPTGMAIKTGEIQVNQNFATNPAMAPWAAEALKRNYQSSIALPLRHGHAVFGALTVYASQPNAFDTQEVSLLADLADDISYGVTALRSSKAAAS